jgi:hypothetical protein
MQEISRPNIYLIELISLHVCVFNLLHHRGSPSCIKNGDRICNKQHGQISVRLILLNTVELYSSQVNQTLANRVGTHYYNSTLQQFHHYRH